MRVGRIQATELLDREVQALDSAMLVAQAAAAQGPVHSLRTSTRRLEAQVVLLQRLSGYRTCACCTPTGEML